MKKQAKSDLAILKDAEESRTIANLFMLEQLKPYPNIQNVFPNEKCSSYNCETIRKENLSEEEQIAAQEHNNNNIFLNTISKHFHYIIKFLDFYSMHRFYYCSKQVMSVVCIQREYANLCDRYISDYKKKKKKYKNSLKRLLLEYPRIRYDGVYINSTNYIRVLNNPGNIHLNEEDRKRLMRSSYLVSYYRFLLFLNNTNKVLIIRSNGNKKDVVESLKRAYNEVISWDLSLSCNELHKKMLKFQESSDSNSILKYIRLGEYTYFKTEKSVEIKYAESLSEPDKYINRIGLQLISEGDNKNNTLHWKFFKVLPSASCDDKSEDTLTLRKEYFKSFYFFNLKFLSHVFITHTP